ncbi:MAG: hypothetical protein HKN87_10245 [Saprospiraceae bacterium]|nr:hypothetical protein [Saprospiraceae bacterium]
MEGVDTQSSSEVSVTNDLHIEVFDAQRNMVVFTSPGFLKFELFNVGKPRTTMSME